MARRKKSRREKPPLLGRIVWFLSILILLERAVDGAIDIVRKLLGQ